MSGRVAHAPRGPIRSWFYNLRQRAQKSENVIGRCVADISNKAQYTHTTYTTLRTPHSTLTTSHKTQNTREEKANSARNKSHAADNEANCGSRRVVAVVEWLVAPLARGDSAGPVHLTYFTSLLRPSAFVLRIIIMTEAFSSQVNYPIEGSSSRNNSSFWTRQKRCQHTFDTFNKWQLPPLLLLHFSSLSISV